MQGWHYGTAVLFHFTHLVTSGYSISIIRDPARGTSQLYLRVARTSAFKQFFLFNLTPGHHSYSEINIMDSLKRKLLSRPTKKVTECGRQQPKVKTLLLQRYTLRTCHVTDGKTRVIRLRVIEGPNVRDQISLCAFYSFLVGVQTNADYIHATHA